jgi:hypothetical protein
MQGYEVVAVTTRAGKTQTGPPQKEKQTCPAMILLGLDV